MQAAMDAAQAKEGGMSHEDKMRELQRMGEEREKLLRYTISALLSSIYFFSFSLLHLLIFKHDLVTLREIFFASFFVLNIDDYFLICFKRAEELAKRLALERQLEALRKALEREMEIRTLREKELAALREKQKVLQSRVDAASKASASLSSLQVRIKEGELKRYQFSKIDLVNINIYK